MNKKLTIGIFVDSYFPMIDGVAMVIDNYAKRLSNYANVVVFCPKYPGRRYNDRKFNYKVVRCISAKIPFVYYNLPAPKLDIRFERKLNKYNLDIVHIHSPFTIGKLGISYAKKHDIPIIGTMHSQFKQDFKQALKVEKMANFLTNEIVKVFDKCDRCYSVNKEVARIFHEEYGCKKMPGVINNATDMKLCLNEEFARNYVNKLYKINDDYKVFLFVGRLSILKNIFFIVDAISLLKKRNIFKFKVLFVGTGPEEEELKEYIRENELEKEIILCGKVEDREILKYYYNRADLFLFPSLYDTNSLVQIEAASQKTPTLFIKGAATAATIRDKRTGFFSRNNPNSYAKEIEIIMKNKRLYDRVCENAYKEVYVTWDSTVEKVYNIYLEMIEEKKSSPKEDNNKKAGIKSIFKFIKK